ILAHSPLAPRLTLAPLASTISFSRNYSSPSKYEKHFHIEEFGLFSSFVPVPKRYQPPFFSKDGVKYIKNLLKNKYHIWTSILRLKWNLKSWKMKPFESEAEALYCAMNTAYAEGDVETLSMICKPTLLSTLKREIKHRNVGFEWTATPVNPPKVVKILCATVAPGLTIAQAVLRIDQIQNVKSVGKGRQASSKTAGTSARVIEYVVFQRIITEMNSPWSIYGKIDVP
ncbi:hypothetical protein BX070DRAFT_177625, partial [Coemansia spiralis]